MTFRSRWSCDIQFHKYAVHINQDFYDKLRPQILSVGTTANAALSDRFDCTSSYIYIALLRIRINSCVRSKHSDISLFWPRLSQGGKINDT